MPPKKENYKELYNLSEKISDFLCEKLSDKDFDDVYEKIHKIKVWICKQEGHSFDIDHCGMWAHKFCECCGEAQYPELIKKRCKEIKEMLGDTTEEEYIKNKEEKP